MASSIETVAQTRPADYQVSTGTSIRVPLFAGTKEEDVHFAQVECTANSVVTEVSPGWFLVDAIRSGGLEGDISQEIWAFICWPGQPIPTEVTFAFSQSNGEKWVGTTTLRYADINALVSAVLGFVPGEPDIIIAILYAYVQVREALARGELAVGYSYVNLLQALARGQLAIGYSYSRVIQRLVGDKLGATYSVARIIQRLTADKLAMSYSYVKIIQNLVADKQGTIYSYVSVQSPP